MAGGLRALNAIFNGKYKAALEVSHTRYHDWLSQCSYILKTHVSVTCIVCHNACAVVDNT